MPRNPGLWDPTPLALRRGNSLLAKLNSPKPDRNDRVQIVKASRVILAVLGSLSEIPTICCACASQSIRGGLIHHPQLNRVEPFIVGNQVTDNDQMIARLNQISSNQQFDRRINRAIRVGLER